MPNGPDESQNPPADVIGNDERVGDRRILVRNVGAILAIVSGLAAMAHTQFGVVFPPHSLLVIAVMACVGIGQFSWGGGWRPQR